MKRFLLILLLLGIILPEGESMVRSAVDNSRGESSTGEVLAQSEAYSNGKDSRRDRWKNRDRRKERRDRDWDTRNPENSRVESLRMRKMMEVLQLNDDQREQFMPLFMKMRRVRREAAKEHRRMMYQLNEGLQGRTMAESVLEKVLTAVHALNEKSRDDENRFLEKARKVLSVHQWGRLVVFQDRFEIETIGRLSRRFRKDAMEIMPDSGFRHDGRPEFRKIKKKQ